MKIIAALYAVLLFSVIIGCSSSPIQKNQGVYIVDKDSLKSLMEGNIETNNRLALVMLEKMIENAVIELELKGDSIDGILFLAGESTIYNSRVSLRNDTMLVDLEGKEAYLIPSQSGLRLKNKGSSIAIPLLKTEQNALSEDTQKAMAALRDKSEKKKQFESNMGVWQRGRFVDEFGDATDGGFAVAIVRGTNQNTLRSGSEILVKTVVQQDGLYFEIYDASMTMKESLPDSEFGQIKIKFPDGGIKSEKVFFYKNMISESTKEKQGLIYQHLMNNDQEVKLFLDLSTASKYHSDTYQFSLRQNNLREVMSDLSLLPEE